MDGYPHPSGLTSVLIYRMFTRGTTYWPAAICIFYMQIDAHVQCRMCVETTTCLVRYGVERGQTPACPVLTAIRPIPNTADSLGHICWFMSLFHSTVTFMLYHRCIFGWHLSWIRWKSGKVSEMAHCANVRIQQGLSGLLSGYRSAFLRPVSSRWLCCIKFTFSCWLIWSFCWLYHDILPPRVIK